MGVEELCLELCLRTRDDDRAAQAVRWPPRLIPEQVVVRPSFGSTGSPGTNEPDRVASNERWGVHIPR